MYRSIFFIVAVVLASSSVSSCGLLGEDANSLRIISSLEHYDLVSDDTLHAIITNLREPAFYYICYPDIWLEQLERDKVIGRWQIRGQEKCGSIGKIALGQSQSFVLPVRLEVSAQPQNVELHYRLETRLYRDRDGYEMRNPAIDRSRPRLLTGVHFGRLKEGVPTHHPSGSRSELLQLNP